MSVDTLSLAKELRAADFASPQAEAIAAAIGRSVSETTATKADLSELRAAGKADLLQLGTELRGEIAQLGTELRGEIAQLGTELRAEIGKLGAELRTEIGKLGAELRTEIERSRNATMIWVIGSIFAAVGLAIAAAKFIPFQG